MSNIDLSVKVKGLTFRNPIMPGSSDIVLDERGVIKCLEQGIANTVFIENQPPAKVRQFLYTADVLAVVPRNADLEKNKMGILRVD